MLFPDRVESLRQGWDRLMGEMGVSPVDAAPVFDRLIAAYSEPHRHYHNLEHIAEMLPIIDQLESLATDPAAVRLAVWFHDVVYDPNRHDNEERSAERASDELQICGTTLPTRVAELVRATDHSRSQTTGDTEVDLLLDADLAILGADDERYRRYADDVRREYAWVPDEAYREGRANVLRSFLQRDRIFRTAPMGETREQPARRNIHAEIERLTSGG